MPKPYVVVDAFTGEPFRGNPAAVVLLNAARSPSDQWMQSVAREFNLSETAFVYPREDDGFRLRWFTPACEVDLCGHATLAAAFALWQNGTVAANQAIKFETRSGRLTAYQRRPPSGSADHPFIEIDFPVTPVCPAAAPRELTGCFRTGSQPLRWQFVGKSPFDLLLRCATEAEVCGIEADFRRLAALPCRGIIVTAPSDHDQYDFVSRFFAPAAGVDEDPVTGSAHCALIDYWGQQLGREELTGYQASARGGIVHMKRTGDRVALSGQAVLFCRGELLCSPPV